MTTKRSDSLTINRLTLHDDHPDSRQLHFTTDEDFSEAPATGVNTGAVLVRLNVDHEHDSVTLDSNGSSEFRALSAAIEHLQRVHDVLAEFSASAADGWCMDAGDWGRCKGRDGHDGTHDFPTEVEYRQSNPR